VDVDLEITSIEGPDDEELLDAFHGGIYRDVFRDSQEPIAVWKRALWGGVSSHELTIQIAGRNLRDPARREILGGIAFERYPRCGCGLISYMVIAPAARRHGVGRRLQRGAADALFAGGAPAVFGELDDPRRRGEGVAEPAYDMWRRIERNQVWGARIVDARYVQPALAPGLPRDRGLCLIALSGADPLPPTISGQIVRDFIEDRYLATEGSPPDRALLAAIPERVALIELQR